MILLTLVTYYRQLCNPTNSKQWKLFHLALVQAVVEVSPYSCLSILCGTYSICGIFLTNGEPQFQCPTASTILFTGDTVRYISSYSLSDQSQPARTRLALGIKIHNKASGPDLFGLDPGCHSGRRIFGGGKDCFQPPCPLSHCPGLGNYGSTVHGMFTEMRNTCCFSPSRNQSAAAILATSGLLGDPKVPLASVVTLIAVFHLHFGLLYNVNKH